MADKSEESAPSSRAPALKYNIQLLRALAAYAVVGHHIIDTLRHYVAVGHVTMDPKIGATGVNVFFVISGYIMMETTSRRDVTPQEFMMHRLIRVAPLYWVLTLFAVAITQFGISLFGHTSISAEHIIRSLLFLPQWGADGRSTVPVLFVGWTLNYEMMFYAGFAACLLLPTAEMRLWAGCAGIAALWLAALVSDNAYLVYWGNDVIIAFALGMLVWRAGLVVSPPVFVSWAAAAVGIAILALPDIISALGTARHGPLVPNIGAALIVYAALSLERRGTSVGDGWLKRQGDASYSLYLLHPFVLQTVGKAWLVAHVGVGVGRLAVLVVLMLLASGISGTLLHLYVERPMTEAIRRAFDRHEARRALA